MQFSAPLHDATPEHGFPISPPFSFDRILVHKKVQFGGNHTTGASFLSLPINLARRRVRKGRLLRAVVCHKKRPFLKKIMNEWARGYSLFSGKVRLIAFGAVVFLSVLFSVQQVRLLRNGGAGGARIRNSPDLVPFSQFGEEVWVWPGCMANLSLRCLLGVFSLSCEPEMIRLDRRAELAEEEQEKGRWWNRVVSFFPSCNKGPVDKRVWKRHPLSLSRNNFGGSGKGRPFVLHFAKRTFSLCSLCSWQKKGGKFALPFPKKTRIVQTRLNDTAWRID